MKPLIENITLVESFTNPEGFGGVTISGSDFDRFEFARLYNAKISFIMLARDSWEGEERRKGGWMVCLDEKGKLEIDNFGDNSYIGPICAYFRKQDDIYAAINKIGKSVLIDIIKNGV